MKKSQIIREMIAEAKAQGQTQNELITAVREACGFSRQLARAYINNNWAKVVASAAQPEVKPAKALSMTKDAIRKRELRAQQRAQRELAAA